MMATHHVYIIGSKPGVHPIKIGFTTDCKKRLASLQTASPFELCIFKKLTLSWKNATELERAMHIELIARRMKGEWFNCHPRVALNIIGDIRKKTKNYTDWSVYKKEHIVRPWFSEAHRKGALISARRRKAKTAAAFALIDHELRSTKVPSKQLLATVGIRAIGSIKNHYKKCRADLQRDYQAELKRKARRQKAKAA